MLARILIIDDAREAADLLASIMELNGHFAQAVYDPAQGLVCVVTFEPDIVFLDIGLPEMNGYQVAQRIRGDSTLRQPYLIAYTAWNDKAALARASEAGFDLHLTKPCDVDLLLTTVRNFQ